MIAQTVGFDNKNPLYNPQYQKALREYHQARPQFSELLQMHKEALKEYKRKRIAAKKRLEAQRDKLAEDTTAGNKHAVILTDLKQETESMRGLLSSVTSIERIELPERVRKVVYDEAEGTFRETFTIVKRMGTLKEYADKQAFALDCCSKKTVYKFNQTTGKAKFMYAQRCGRRTCSVCAHFDSLAERKLLMVELQKQLAEMDREKLKKGRLVHLVFTHENVDIDRVFDNMDVWRTIQKQKVKKRGNVHTIWNVLEWGIYRWEITRDEDTGLYHPHLHVLAFTTRWLAPEKGGDWSELVHSWQTACENKGLHAAWEGQFMGHVLHFSDKEQGEGVMHVDNVTDLDRMMKALDDSAAEMTKYPLKSTDFTKIMRTKDGQIDEQLANEIAKLFYMMKGRRLKNGFGGFKLRELPEGERDEINREETAEETEGDELELVYEWDKHAQCYTLLAARPWSESRFEGLLLDMSDFRNRRELWMYYGLEDD